MQYRLRPVRPIPVKVSSNSFGRSCAVSHSIGSSMSEGTTIVRSGSGALEEAVTVEAVCPLVRIRSPVVHTVVVRLLSPLVLHRSEPRVLRSE